MLNKICRLLLFVLVSCLFVSCEDENEPSADYDVLVIGNSYARDAFSYVPCVLASVNPEVSVNLHVIGTNGADLAQTHKNILEGEKCFFYDKYLFNKGEWTSTSKSKAGKVITSKEWNLIVLQENSVVATDYKKTKKNVNKLVSLLRKKKCEAPIAFMLNPTHPENSKLLDSIGLGNDDEFYVITEVAQILLKDGAVDFIIPCGTAIQNARHTSLNTYGDFGQLSFDGNHLQEGLPCLIEAYTASQFLLDKFLLFGNIDNSCLFVTDGWIKNKRIPGQHGNVVVGTFSDYLLCKKCAKAALSNPYSITLLE